MFQRSALLCHLLNTVEAILSIEQRLCLENARMLVKERVSGSFSMSCMRTFSHCLFAQSLGYYSLID